MTDLIGQPRIMMAAGNKPKQIAENVARLNSGVEALSGRSRYWTETLRFSDFLEVDRVNRGFSQPVSTQCIFSFWLAHLRIKITVHYHVAVNRASIYGKLLLASRQVETAA